MKKVLFILCAVACMSFTTTVDDAVACPDNSSPIFSSCWSGCVSVPVQLTGYLDIDAGIADQGGLRKPNPTEFARAQQILDDFCDR